MGSGTCRSKLIELGLAGICCILQGLAGISCVLGLAGVS